MSHRIRAERQTFKSLAPQDNYCKIQQICAILTIPITDLDCKVHYCVMTSYCFLYLPACSKDIPCLSAAHNTYFVLEVLGRFFAKCSLGPHRAPGPYRFRTKNRNLNILEVFLEDMWVYLGEGSEDIWEYVWKVFCKSM